MTVTKSAARHRSDAKTSTPITDITDTFVSGAFARKGVAAASVTGIALTATVAGSAIAEPAPTTIPTNPSNDFVSNLSATESATLVSLEMDWDPGDDVGATAAEPVVEQVQEAVVDTVADRDYDRASGEQAATFVPPSTAGGVAGTALQFVGYPYVWGGTGPGGFDCSGFVQYVFGLNGIGLPRMSGDQGRSGTMIPASEAQPGDLVVWGESHIAIYIGDGMIVHASTPATGVKVSPLYGSYYFSRV